MMILAKLVCGVVGVFAVLGVALVLVVAVLELKERLDGRWKNSTGGNL